MASEASASSLSRNALQFFYQRQKVGSNDVDFLIDDQDNREIAHECHSRLIARDELSFD